MKNGLMYYLAKDGKWKNIGDYIQSVAADQFMHASEMIEREDLWKYRGEKLKVILNGWFMHYPKRFPPSEDIVPLFLSFHIRPNIAKRLLTEKTITYMKRYEPIGCRDMSTVRILEKAGVKAYFSNCLTLTLGMSFHRHPDAEKGPVCIVDPLRPFNPKCCLCALPFMLLHPILAIRILMRMKRQKGAKVNWKTVFGMGAFIRAYSTLFDRSVLENAEYVTHAVSEQMFSSEEEKMEYSRWIVEKYAGARYCVTSRIHCALPCVAVGTPVVFVDSSIKNFGKGRFEGVTELFNLAVTNGRRLIPKFEFSSSHPRGLIDMDTKLPTTDRHLPYVREMAAKCEEFARMGME